MSAIKEIKLPSSTIVQTEPAPQFIKEMDLLQKWNSGELSNYEFFLLFNIYSGRSFNDTNIYPIFPWLEVDFTKKPNSPRDFTRPLAAQIPGKEEKFINQIKGFSNDINTRFLYGIGISAPVFVSYYMYRIEPFRSIYAKLTNGLDKDDLLFRSVHYMFQQIEQSDENREMIP